MKHINKISNYRYMLHVNCHEPKEIQNLLKEKTPIEVKYFTPGDYIIGSSIGIERKTYPDFVSSLVSNRLFEQLERLRFCYQISYLILEIDDYMHFKHNQIIYGPIITILANLNIKIIVTLSKKQTVHAILVLANNGLRYRDLGMIQHKPKMVKRAQIPLKILQTIPGIGFKRARLLLQHFGNLQNIFTAQESEMEDKKGLGKNTVKMIGEILSIEHSQNNKTLKQGKYPQIY